MKLALGQEVYGVLYIFCTNVMSGLVMSSLPLLCADLRFGLPPASPLPQSPIRRSFSLLLDFLTSPLHFKVQSATLARSFWTFSHLPSASKSNPPLLLAPFGLSHISPPLQSPIRRSFSLLLDFLTSPLRFNVQSAALSRSFWTSSHLLATSKSNPPLLLAPPRKKGGLQRNPPILIRQSQSANLIPAIPINQPNPPSANSTK